MGMGMPILLFVIGIVLGIALRSVVLGVAVILIALALVPLEPRSPGRL